MVKTVGRDALTWLRDHEAAAAGFDHHTACYPGNDRITMGVTGGQATTRLPGTQPSGHMHAGIAARTGVADPAICHGMTAGAVSDLDLSGTFLPGSPRDADQAAARAWLRDTQRRRHSQNFEHRSSHVMAPRKTRL